MLAQALSKVLDEPVKAYVVVAELENGQMLKTWWKPGGMPEEEANAWLIDAVFGAEWEERRKDG